MAFEPNTSRQIFCSKKCRNRWWAKDGYQKHKEDRLAYQRTHAQRANELNKAPHRKAQRSKATKEKRMNDPIFKLKMSIIDRLRREESFIDRDSIARKLNDVLPYTWIELWNYLLTTMPEGYTTRDYLDGKLEVDHIIPYARFIMFNVGDEEFLKCWNMRNLRLVSKIHNRTRGSKPTFIELKKIEEHGLVDLLPSGPDVIYERMKMQDVICSQ